MSAQANAAYAELVKTMENTPPACEGIDLFTEDHLDKADKDVLQQICHQCPVRALCDAYAKVARPTGGYWNGYSKTTYLTKDAD